MDVLMDARSKLKGWLISPASFVALCICVALAAVLQYSVRAFIPGSLDVGGLTLANFSGLGKQIYLDAFVNTLRLSVETTIFSILVAYPLAYALVRVRNRFIKSFILIVSITPLFLGEIVRTYSWIIVLGNNGFINTVLRKLGIIDQPLTLPYRPRLREGGRKPGRGAGAHLPDGDAAVVHARHPGQRDHCVCLDLQRLRHAPDDRRRPRSHRVHAGLSVGIRIHELPLGSQPEHRGPGLDRGRADVPGAGHSPNESHRRPLR
jgi:hypothetical protein